MKHWSSIAALLVAATSFAALAQGKGDKGGKGADEYLRAQSFMNAAPAAQATVARLLTNTWGEVDGLLLDTGTIVTFPPHMGMQLAAAVKKGDTVTVKGYPEAPTQIRGYVITNTASNQTVMTLPPPPPGTKMPPHLRGVGLKEMSAQGEVKQLRFGRRGEVNGVILADGTTIRLSRDAAARVQPIKPGERISATGYGTQNDYGRAFDAVALGTRGESPQPLYQR